MSKPKKKQDSLLIKLMDGDRHKHRVALVTEEGEWNQHEPNTGMARMFVVMLLIHVVLIGGIIIYDFMGDEESPAQTVTQAARSQSSASGLPQASEAVINAQALAAANTEEYDQYQMRSGDSVRSIAEKFSTTEDNITQLNLLDKGIQIGPGTLLRVPKTPVPAAVAVDPTTLKPVATSDEAPKAIPFTLDQPQATQGTSVSAADAPASIAAAASPMSLLTPNEAVPAGNSLAAAAETPATTAAPLAPIEQIGSTSNPLAVSVLAEAANENDKAIAAAEAAEKVEAVKPKATEVKKEVAKPAPKPLARPNPVPPPTQMIKRLADTPPAPKKSEPKKSTATSRTHTLANGETLYRLASKYGVSVDAIQKANNIKNPNSMRLGMKLVIPAK